MCIDKLDDMVNEYINTYSTIKTKLVEVNSSTCIDFNVENDDKDPKFLVGDHVRISKYTNISHKVALRIGLKKFLQLKT